MKKTPLFLIILCLVISLALAACAAPGTATPNTLAGTSWKLTSYGPAASPKPAAPDVETNLSFGADGRVNGNFGCNSFGGDYTVKDDTLLFGAIMTTLMACESSRMEQESAGLQVMKDTVHYKLDGSTLTITSSDGGNVLTLTTAAGK